MSLYIYTVPHVHFWVGLTKTDLEYFLGHMMSELTLVVITMKDPFETVAPPLMINIHIGITRTIWIHQTWC